MHDEVGISLNENPKDDGTYEAECKGTFYEVPVYTSPMNYYTPGFMCCGADSGALTYTELPTNSITSDMLPAVVVLDKTNSTDYSNYTNFSNSTNFTNSTNSTNSSYYQLTFDALREEFDNVKTLLMDGKGKGSCAKMVNKRMEFERQNLAMLLK